MKTHTSSTEYYPNEKNKEEIKLDPHQFAFIEKCKATGKKGCSLTINNQQIYVSFY